MEANKIFLKKIREKNSDFECKKKKPQGGKKYIENFRKT